MRAILTYHSIDASRSPISLDESAFRRHVMFFASRRVRVVPLESIADQDPGADAVAITFDDGFANFADAAWPMLRERGLPVTVFVVSGRVGLDNAWHGHKARDIPILPLMTWDVLGRLAEGGVTLGAHTRTHANLRRLSEAALTDEIVGCADDIAARTGARPATFAYPYGEFDRAVSVAAGRTFTFACTTELRELGSRPDRLTLPRLDAYYLQEQGRLESWGTPAFSRYIGLRATLRTVRSGVLSLMGRIPS